MLFISRFKLRLGNRGQQNRVKHAQDVACLRECCSGSYCGGIGISRGLETGSFVHQVLNPRVRLVNLIGEIPISRTRALGSRVRGLTQESSFFARNFQLDQGVPGGLGGPVDRSRSACSTSCSIRTGDGTPTHISTRMTWPPLPTDPAGIGAVGLWPSTPPDLTTQIRPGAVAIRLPRFPTVRET